MILIHYYIYFYICSISPKRFEELAESTVELFPTYLKETIYNRSNGKSNARGVMQSSYETMREKALARKKIIRKSRLFEVAHSIIILLVIIFI